MYGRGCLEVSTVQCFEIAPTLTGNVNVGASDSKYSEKRGPAPEGTVWELDSIHGSWLSFWYDAELSFVHSNYTVVDEINNRHERYYQYDSSGMLIAELDGNGETLVEYIYLNSQRIAFVIANEIYFIHTNHLDAPIAITNSAAEAVWSGYYTPFGKLIETTNELTGAMALRFPGQYADSETGLYYNYFRDYDPELGRYIQSDPIGLAGGINTYGYVLQNPVSYNDRLGLLVDIVLDTGTNTLTAVDRDTGQSLSMQAFTGGQVLGDGTIEQPNTSPYLAAPKGTYLITDNPNFRPEYPDWYGLLKNDSRIDDYFDDNGNDRSGARLHYGSTSYGCATVTSKDQWSKLDKLLNGTKTQQAQFIKGPHFWNPTGNITQYGTLTVK